jgi:hypothetical protein
VTFSGAPANEGDLYSILGEVSDLMLDRQEIQRTVRLKGRVGSWNKVKQLR